MKDVQSNPVLSPLFCFANIQNYFNMSDLNQLIKRLEEKKSALVAFHDKRWPARVGEIAIAHFKKNFRNAGWNDNGLTRWKRTRRQEQGGKDAYYNRTPLLSDSDNLYGGFTYKAGMGRVTVENNVEYAPIHNTGGIVQHRITPRMRKYAWRRFFESAGITREDSPEVRKQKEAAMNDHDRMWKRLALTPKQTSTVHIPQRKFMGQSTELAQKVRDYTEGELLKIIGDI